MMMMTMMIMMVMMLMMLTTMTMMMTTVMMKMMRMMILTTMTMMMTTTITMMMMMKMTTMTMKMTMTTTRSMLMMMHDYYINRIPKHLYMSYMQKCFRQCATTKPKVSHYTRRSICYTSKHGSYPADPSETRVGKHTSRLSIQGLDDAKIMLALFFIKD